MMLMMIIVIVMMMMMTMIMMVMMMRVKVMITELHLIGMRELIFHLLWPTMKPKQTKKHRKV